MNFDVPDGHYLVGYDYGTGGLWWILKADSADQIRTASADLNVYGEAPSWMGQDDWDRIVRDDLRNPKDEALKLILSKKI